LQNLHICWDENVVLGLINVKIIFTRPWRGEEFPNFLVSICWGRHVVWFGVWASAKIGRLEGSGRKAGIKGELLVSLKICSLVYFCTLERKWKICYFFLSIMYSFPVPCLAVNQRNNVLGHGPKSGDTTGRRKCGCRQGKIR